MFFETTWPKPFTLAPAKEARIVITRKIAFWETLLLPKGQNASCEFVPNYCLL